MLTESKKIGHSKLLLELAQLKLIQTASYVLENLRGAPCRTFVSQLIASYMYFMRSVTETLDSDWLRSFLFPRKSYF